MARDFDGANDSINVGNDASLGIVGDMSLVAWINCDDFANFNGVFGKTAGAGNNIPAPNDCYIVQTSGIPRMFRGNGTLSDFSDATTALTTGTTQHIGFTFGGTGSKDIRHYLNGSADGTKTLVTTIGNGATNQLIGNRGDSVTDMKGNLSYIAVWNIRLTATEIAIMARGVNPFLVQNASLQGFWPLYGNDDPEPDFGNAQINKGTLTGTTKATNSAPVEPIENYL